MQNLTSRSSAAFALISATGLLLISASASAFHHHEKGQQRGPIVIDEVAERAKTAGARQFQKADANNDDFISLDEFEQHTPKRLARKRAMFKMLDSNEDGKLSKDEMPNPEKSLRALDSNNDGVVDRAEMAKLRKRWKQ